MVCFKNICKIIWNTSVLIVTLSRKWRQYRLPVLIHPLFYRWIFSENTTITAQIELQAAHWHHYQATLFTAHAWINKDTSFNIIGFYDLDHTKYSIVSMQHVNHYSYISKQISHQLMRLTIGNITCNTGSKKMRSQSHGTSLRHCMERLLLMEV